MSKPGQPKWLSWFEASLNTFGGFAIALTTQVITFPWFGINIPLSQNALITCIFMVISLVRGYMFRRLINWVEHIHLPKRNAARAGRDISDMTTIMESGDQSMYSTLTRQLHR